VLLIVSAVAFFVASAEGVLLLLTTSSCGVPVAKSNNCCFQAGLKLCICCVYCSFRINTHTPIKCLPMAILALILVHTLRRV
jgi:hypothetical protein